MSNKTKFTEEQIQYVKEQYNNPYITVLEIAENLGINPSTLNRYTREWGIRKVVKTKWTPKKIEWLKKNYNKTYKEMLDYLNICEEVIRLKINELGLKRTTKYRPFKIDMKNKEFLSDLDNPRLTAPDIVEKYKDIYGIGESRIHQLRKERGIKLQINTLATESGAEKIVREILEDLDLAYISEKRIGKYSIDFYLGFKLCIEVQGDYWHKLPRRIKSDKRKKEYLESKGYKILYLWESELDKAREDIFEFVKIQGLPIQ